MGGIGAPEFILIFLCFGSFGFALLGYKIGARRTIGSTGGLLLGFLLGPLGVLIVYCTGRIDNQQFNYYPPLSAADEIQKYKHLLDSGAITGAEYNVKKREILWR